MREREKERKESKIEGRQDGLNVKQGGKRSD